MPWLTAPSFTCEAYECVEKEEVGAGGIGLVRYLGNQIGVLLHGPAKPGIWKIRKWIVAEVVHICLDASGQAVWRVTLSGSLSGRARAFSIELIAHS